MQGSASDATITVDATAPTATLTGAPSGTDNTTTLAVTVGGTGVTHYKSVASAGASCPSGTKYGTSPTSLVSSVGYNPDGVAATATRLYFVTNAAGYNTKAQAYNRTTGAAVTTDDITLATDNVNSSGATTDGTTLWVLDGADDKLYAYTISTKTRDTSKEFTLHSDNGSGGGLTLYNNHFYVVDDINNKVYAYTKGGTRVAAKDFAINSANGSAITHNGTHFFLNNHYGTPNYKFDAYTVDGVRAPLFDITGLQWASGTYDYYGATIYGNTFYYIPGGSVKYVTAVSTGVAYGSEAAVATNITDSISLVADGSVILCVAGRDAAGNYQSTPTTTSWTKDAYCVADYLLRLLQRHERGNADDVGASV